MIPKPLFAWSLQVGNMAVLISDERFGCTELAAVRRWRKAVRANPDKIVELYRVVDTAGTTAAIPWRTARPPERSRVEDLCRNWGLA